MSSSLKIINFLSFILKNKGTLAAQICLGVISFVGTIKLSCWWILFLKSICNSNLSFSSVSTWCSRNSISCSLTHFSHWLLRNWDLTFVIVKLTVIVIIFFVAILIIDSWSRIVSSHARSWFGFFSLLVFVLLLLFLFVALFFFWDGNVVLVIRNLVCLSWRAWFKRSLAVCLVEVSWLSPSESIVHGTSHIVYSSWSILIKITLSI